MGRWITEIRIISHLVDRNFAKAAQGPGRKGRLRRKHRREMASDDAPAGLPQSAAGAGNPGFAGQKNTPAKTKNGYVPHDCKQSEFPSGPLE